MIRATAADELHWGDCAEVLKTLEANSVDAVVTDPPYGLKFMGRKWDYDVPAVAVWREALRVLKPGGHLLSFGGTRTYHRMVVNIEDAGFEIRDCVAWVFGSGFPKSLDVGKAIDKAHRRDYVLAAIALGLSIPGNSLHDWTKAEHAPSDKWWGEFKTVLTPEQWGAIEREVVGQRVTGINTGGGATAFIRDGNRDITAPATDAARRWQGWGSALKPAHEPVCVARKPLIGTLAANVLTWGTGALNIDGCRIDAAEERPWRVARRNLQSDEARNAYGRGLAGSMAVEATTTGRWPANVAHDGSPEVLALFPEANGGHTPRARGPGGVSTSGHRGQGAVAERHHGHGSAARFFYCAKASRKDRDEGCEALPPRPLYWSSGTQNPGSFQSEGTNRSARNPHPCVKPTALMRWLCRLVTPPGVVVLDPFMGSGSTGKACALEGFRFIGIEREAEYVEIARARIAAVKGKNGTDNGQFCH